jgi:phage-related holin
MLPGPAVVDVWCARSVLGSGNIVAFLACLLAVVMCTFMALETKPAIRDACVCIYILYTHISNVILLCTP